MYQPLKALIVVIDSHDSPATHHTSYLLSTLSVQNIPEGQRAHLFFESGAFCRKTNRIVMLLSVCAVRDARNKLFGAHHNPVTNFDRWAVRLR